MFLPQSFESRDVVKFVGVTERELRHWADLKIIVPDIANAVGRPGIRRKYSFQNLVESGIVKTLLNQGLTLHEAGRILKRYQKSFTKDLPGPLYLVVQEGNQLHWYQTKKARKTFMANLEKLLDPQMDRDAFLIVAIHHIQDRLRHQIKSISTQK